MQKIPFYSFLFPCLLACLLGAIGTLSYAPFHLFYLSYVSFIGLMMLVSLQKTKRVYATSFFWGMSYFLTGIHWIFVSIDQFSGASPLISGLIVVAFAFYLTLYPLLFTFVVRLLRRFVPDRTFMQLVFLMPLTWFLTEWIRAHFLNGFAWLQLGYAQLDTPIRHFFPLIGIDGVHFLFTIICGLIAFVIYQTLVRLNHELKAPTIRVQRLYWMALASLILIFLLAFQLQTHQWTRKQKATLPIISLVQGNVAQSVKWDPHRLNKIQELYLNAIQQRAKISQLIILPEAAIPDLERFEQPYLETLDHIAHEEKTGIVLGILTEKNQEILNSAIGFSPDSTYVFESSTRYDKQHLVPFGEYTPLAGLFKPLADYLDIPMSSMAEGAVIQAPMKLNGYSLLMSICYEVILSDRFLANFDPSINFLVTISNDAWFGDSIGPWQHLQMAQARALEFGRPLLRATNSGITAIIRPNGQIQTKLPQFKSEILTASVPLYKGQTPYSQYGHSVLYGWLALWLLLLLFAAYRHNASSRQSSER